MKTTLLTWVTFAILVASDASAQDAPAPPLPANIQSILSVCEDAIGRNRAAYDAANRKYLETAEGLLRAEIDKLAGAGKLDEALAVRKVLKGLRPSLVSKVDARANSAATAAKPIAPAPGNPPSPAPVAGGRQIKVLKAVYGPDASSRNDVTDFVENLVKIEGLVRIPHATWQKPNSGPDDKLFIEFRDPAGEKRTLAFPKGHLFKPKDDLK
jgi:hypothetical protein